MSVKLEMYISDSDFNRICSIKKANNADDMSIQEYAGKLLSDKLFEFRPHEIAFDEHGNER